MNDVEQAWASYETAMAMATRYHGHYLEEATRVRNNLERSAIVTAAQPCSITLTLYATIARQTSTH